MTHFEKLPIHKAINYTILGPPTALLFFPVTCVAYNLPKKVQEKTKLVYGTTLIFISTNLINIGIFGGVAYEFLSNSFPDGIIPGMPKEFNTPAAAAFGLVAIASLTLTLLVAGIAYNKAAHYSKLDNVHYIREALTWTNPITGLVNLTNSIYSNTINCCKSSKGYQST